MSGARFRKPEIKRAVEAFRESGISNWAMCIEPDGTLRFEVSQPGLSEKNSKFKPWSEAHGTN